MTKAKQIELDFNAASELAAEVERKGDYDYAISLWQLAATLAKKQANFDWCTTRAEFLTRWATRLKEAQEA